MSAEELAQFFHATSERLAPSSGYQTRLESAVDWQHVPANNQQLMIAVAREVLKHLAASAEAERNSERTEKRA